MPEICPGMAETDKINAKACLKRNSHQPTREFYMRTLQSASQGPHFSAAC
jgi:hypothetical protein